MSPETPQRKDPYEILGTRFPHLSTFWENEFIGGSNIDGYNLQTTPLSAMTIMEIAAAHQAWQETGDGSHLEQIAAALSELESLLGDEYTTIKTFLDEKITDPPPTQQIRAAYQKRLDQVRPEGS